MMITGSGLKDTRRRDPRRAAGRSRSNRTSPPWRTDALRSNSRRGTESAEEGKINSLLMRLLTACSREITVILFEDWNYAMQD